MKDINQSLESWLDEMSEFELSHYEKLPDIDLYMDQMLTFLDRQLMPFTLSSLDKPITSSMINNYVKGEVIPAPVSKRYSKEHIAKLLEVCMLKKALSISDIKQVMDSEYENADLTEVYNEFVALLKESLSKTAELTKEKLENIETNDQKALLALSLELSLQASSYMLIAERILNYIRIQNDLNED